MIDPAVFSEWKGLHAKFLALFAEDADELQRSYRASDKMVASVTLHASLLFAALSLKANSDLTGTALKREFLELCEKVFEDQMA